MEIKLLYKKIQLKLQAYFKSDLGFAINTFLIWRLAIFFIGACAFLIFTNGERPAIDYDYGDFWNMWAQWDGWHYVRTSLIGYQSDQHFTAFFPLYPLIMGVLSKIIPVNPIALGLLVSSVALIFAGYFLIKLVKLDFSENVAKKSYIFLLVFPTAIFLASVYTESLFLLWIIGAMYFARKGQWLYAFIFGFFAGLTRNMGVLLCLPLLMEYFYQYRFAIKKQILAISGPFFGLVSYMTYLYIQFGDPIRFVTDQSQWGREIKFNIFSNYTDNLLALLSYFPRFNPIQFFEFALVTLTIILTIIAFIYGKFRKSYAVLMVLLMLPPIMQNIWGSTNRYMLVIFPIYILLAIFADRYKYLGDLLLIIFSLSLALHTVLFVNFMWAG